MNRTECSLFILLEDSSIRVLKGREMSADGGGDDVSRAQMTDITYHRFAQNFGF